MLTLCAWLIQDDILSERLLPLTQNKSLLLLRVGTMTIEERWAYFFPDLSYVINLKDNPDELSLCLFLDAGLVPSFKLAQALSQLQDKEAFCVAGHIVAAGIPSDLMSLFQDLSSAQERNLFFEKHSYVRIEKDLLFIGHLWDILQANKICLEEDFESSTPDYPALIDLVGDPQNLNIAKDLTIYGRVTLNVENGPITIKEGVVIKAPCIIEGPAYIGEKTLVSAARIRRYTTIGPFCKVSGEIGSTIFEGYSNKAHDGYIGDSYIGSWVNLGAMTTTSNLKNNYGIIRVKENGEEAPSGCMYLGAFIGDYVTAGIGTLIPTGATWGPCINIYGGHLGPKYMPPFIWGTQKDWTVYEIDKAKSNFEVMMSRRKMLFNEESIKRFDSIYLSSTKERESFLS